VGILVLWGCSSFFSFSWHTEKKVGAGATAPWGKEGKNPGSTYRVMIQISRLDLKTPKALSSFMERMKRQKIDTVCLRVFQNRGDASFDLLPRTARAGVYFQTSHAPVVSNLLPLICREAHRYGLRIYAWINTLNAVYLKDIPGASRLYAFNPVTRCIARTRRLNPFDPAVRQRLYDLFSDLAENDVDGILIQDDLILHYNEGVGPLAVRLYQADTEDKRLDPAQWFLLRQDGRGCWRFAGYTAAFWPWARWKSRNLALFLRRLIRAAHRVRPAVRVALDVNYELLLSPKNALAWYARDLSTLEEMAHPDQYMVMSYQQQMAEELGKPISVVSGYIQTMVKRAVKQIPDPRRWIFKVQTIDWKTRRPLPLKGIWETMRSIETAAPVSVCLMPYAPFLLKASLPIRRTGPGRLDKIESGIPRRSGRWPAIPHKTRKWKGMS